jgi:regulator of sirC expression with transglutaminase-like and TPR domain
MPNVVDVLNAAQPDIEDVALAIASDAYPALSSKGYRRKLDEMASPIVSRLAMCDDEAKLAGLTEHMYTTLGFRGNEEDYYDPRNSYLNDVIDRQRGIPITLSVIFMALSRRIGLAAEGIGFPGHFIVQVGGAQGPFVDAFDKGHVLPRSHLEGRLAEIMPEGEGLVERQLEAVGSRVMAVRMLFNLQKIYERRGDHARAMVICDRLVDITDAAFHRRDRGRHAMALGAWNTAIEDFSAYLDSTTQPPDHEQITGWIARVQRQEQQPVN